MKKFLTFLLFIPALGFCDSKISQMASTTTLNQGDIIPVVTNPLTNPANKVVTVQNLTNSMNVILNQSNLQTGGTFNISSGTVAGQLTAGSVVAGGNATLSVSGLSTGMSQYGFAGINFSTNTPLNPGSFSWNYPGGNDNVFSLADVNSHWLLYNTSSQASGIGLTLSSRGGTTSPIKGVTLKAPDILGSEVVLTLPNSIGTSGQVLTTDGVSTTSWANAPGGVVTPGTVTWTNTFGMSVSTLTVTSTATVAALSFTGSGNPVFTVPQDVNVYQVMGSSTASTAGQCAQFTSSFTIQGATCGGGGGGTPGGSSGQVQYNSASSFAGVPGSFVTASSVTFSTMAINGSMTMFGPNPANFLSLIESNSLVSWRFFQSGVDDNTISFGSAQAFTVPYGISATNVNRAMSTSSALQSYGSGAAPSLTDGGILELFAATSKPNYISFNENGVANNGAFGFAAGNGRLKYMQGAHDITGGTDKWGVNTDGGMTPYSRTLAQLKVLAPNAVGEEFFCSDCTTDGVVISTGTGTFAFGRISAKTTSPN